MKPVYVAAKSLRYAQALLPDTRGDLPVESDEDLILEPAEIVTVHSLLTME
jgi:hypothetical protein